MCCLSRLDTGRTAGPASRRQRVTRPRSGNVTGPGQIEIEAVFEKRLARMVHLSNKAGADPFERSELLS